MKQEQPIFPKTRAMQYILPFILFCMVLAGCDTNKTMETKSKPSAENTSSEDRAKEREPIPPAEPFTFSDGPMAEEMVVKKVVLGRFDVKDGGIVLNATDPDWPNIDRHNLTVDDHGRIYVLNIRSPEILVFNDAGKVLKKIPLPDSRFDKTFPHAGYLEVNGNGDKFLVNLPARGNRREKSYHYSRRFILDQSGKIIEEFYRVSSFPDIRLCDNTYVFLQGPYMWDENFKEIGELMPKLMDSEGEYQTARGNRLVKYSREGKALWAKQSYRHFSIKGIDSKDRLFLTGTLREGDSRSLYKLNSKGVILSHAPRPDPFPFLTQDEKDEWEFHLSEEIYSIFKFACNGDAYLIHQLGELPSLTFKRWLEKGEYFIYKFVSKK